MHPLLSDPRTNLCCRRRFSSYSSVWSVPLRALLLTAFRCRYHPFLPPFIHRFGTLTRSQLTRNSILLDAMVLIPILFFFYATLLKKKAIYTSTLPTPLPSFPLLKVHLFLIQPPALAPCYLWFPDQSHLPSSLLCSTRLIRQARYRAISPSHRHILLRLCHPCTKPVNP